MIQERFHRLVYFGRRRDLVINGDHGRGDLFHRPWSRIYSVFRRSGAIETGEATEPAR